LSGWLATEGFQLNFANGRGQILFEAGKSLLTAQWIWLV